jgi:hypothetical protein
MTNGNTIYPSKLSIEKGSKTPDSAFRKFHGPDSQCIRDVLRSSTILQQYALRLFP